MSESENNEWHGHLSVDSEICCEVCGEVVHNHFDCPACGMRDAPSKSYSRLEPIKGTIEIQCANCEATFITESDDAYDDDAIWKRV